MVYTNPPDIGAFECRNFQSIKTLVAENNIPCEWKTLQVAHSYMVESMFNHSLNYYRHFSTIDPRIKDLVQVVTKESMHPSLQDLRVPNAVGVFVQKHAASLWPYKLISWVLEKLLNENDSSQTPRFNLQTNTPVIHLQNVENGTWIVHTDRGMISAKNVLLTTNGYTSHLLPAFSDLIVPVRGEMSALIPPPSMKPTSTVNKPLEYSYSFMGHGKQNINQDDYLIQRPFGQDKTGEGGELMFGGGRSYAKNAGVGTSDDSEIDLPAAAYLRKELPKVMDLEEGEDCLKAKLEWSGIMGYSRDGRPWVGELKDGLGLGGGKGLFVCAGYTGHGMPNAWLCGKAASELLLGYGEADIDLPEAYRLSKERVLRAREMEEVHIADANPQLVWESS